MSAGRVYFIGGGPGAADLLTLRGARAIAAADVVVWGRSLVSEELVTEHRVADRRACAVAPAQRREALDVYGGRRNGQPAEVTRSKRVSGGPGTRRSSSVSQ